MLNAKLAPADLQFCCYLFQLRTRFVNQIWFIHRRHFSTLADRRAELPLCSQLFQQVSDYLTVVVKERSRELC